MPQLRCTTTTVTLSMVTFLALTAFAADCPDGSGGSDDLLGVTEHPYTSKEDVYERLRCLESLLYDRGDDRAVFVTVYAAVTLEMSRRIDAGDFALPRWVSDYLVTFANLYRDAFYQYEIGEVAEVPEAWRITFDTAVQGDASTLVNLALGVNAHINNDLAFALYTVHIDPLRAIKHVDHTAINKALITVYDEVWATLADLYDPSLGDLDDEFGQRDEILFALCITIARNMIWEFAEALTDASPVTRRLIAHAIQARAVRYARLLLVSPETPGR